MKKIKVQKKVGLSRPEYQLVNAIDAFYGDEDTVKASFDEASGTVTLTVGDAGTLAALRKRLKAEAKVSATPVKLAAVAASDEIAKEADGIQFEDLGDELDALFKGVLSFFQLATVESEEEAPVKAYALFRNDVTLQFYADDLGNPVGFKTVVPADFAREIFTLGGEASITTEAYE